MFGFFWGVKFIKTYLREYTAESRKELAEWPEQSTKRQLLFIKITAWRPQGRALQPFFGPICAPDFVFFVR
jgi:hypothetical protein